MKIIGPGLWYIIHMYEINDQNDIFDYEELLFKIKDMLPCNICKEDFKVILYENIYRLYICNDYQGVYNFSIYIHNIVNKKLKKRIFKYTDKINFNMNEIESGLWYIIYNYSTEDISKYKKLLFKINILFPNSNFKKYYYLVLNNNIHKCKNVKEFSIYIHNLVNKKLGKSEVEIYEYQCENCNF